MKPYFLQRFFTVILTLLSFAASAQMPYSPCGPSGGKRADVLGVEVKYSAPGSAATVFTIPAGTKSISIYISSETGITNNISDYAQGDEDFITTSAIIDLASYTSSGYVNYAKNTNTDGSGTNVYGWQQAPLGVLIPMAAKIGDATPDLNNVKFTVSGNALTIVQTAANIHSSYHVQYLSPNNNSLNLLEPQVKALLHGTTTSNTELVMPIPAGADIIFISGKGTNSSYADLKTSDGTEEGYANLRFTIDLQANTTNGFVTLANGGSVNRRSTYVVSNLSAAYDGQLIGSGAETGDYTGKSGAAGAVGLYNPNIYISAGHLIIKRDANYARDFDDAYVVEFYKRTGQGMSAEFINSDFKSVPKGQSAATGVSRTFTIPPGTNAIYLSETGNAVNTNRESNENSLEAYAYIDLTNETATGYFYQQVGLSLMERRDDNFAFKGLPLNNTSARSHHNTVGFKGPYNYDISFSLSADKSQLTVTNKTGLANPDYQLLLSADYYGSKPDIAFGASGITFTKTGSSKIIKADLAICNPGSGNSNGGMPVSFYHGDPTTDSTARLLYTGTFPEEIRAGDCRQFSYDIDLSGYDNLDIDVTVVINDDGRYVAGGVGHVIGRTFPLDSLSVQHSTYQECYYGNNLLTKPTNLNNTPVIVHDGLTGAYTYQDIFHAGSTTGTKIADTNLAIIDPDTPSLSSATITLTNVLDNNSEGIYLEGILPAGITISGDSTNVLQLSGTALQSDYIAAIKMLGYKNSKRTPDTSDRIINIAVNDGLESSPASVTTIRIITRPRINVTGNGINIADNSTTANSADGTDFGKADSTMLTRYFTIHNTGTGVLKLTSAIKVDGDGFHISTTATSTDVNGNDSSIFAISFSPASRAAGTYTAVVNILNNDADADRADYSFTVSATIDSIPVPVTPVPDTTVIIDPIPDSTVIPTPVPDTTIIPTPIPDTTTVPAPVTPIPDTTTVPAPTPIPDTTVIPTPVTPIPDTTTVPVPTPIPDTTVIPTPVIPIPDTTTVPVPTPIPDTTVIPTPVIPIPDTTTLPIPTPIPDSTVIPTPVIPIPDTTTLPIPTPIPDTTVIPTTVIPISDTTTLPIPTPIPDTTVIPTPIIPLPDNTTVPVPTPTPDTTVIPTPVIPIPDTTTVPVPTPIPDTTTIPTPVIPIPDTTTVPVPTPIPDTTVIPTPVIPIPDTTTVPAPTPIPDTTVTPATPIPDTTTIPTPVTPIPDTTTVPVPTPIPDTTVISTPIPDTTTQPAPTPDTTSKPISDSISIPPPIPTPAPINGSITLVKTAELRKDNINIGYMLTVTNTGNVTLNNVTLTDPMLKMNKIIGELQAGASASVAVTYRLTQEDRERGRVINTAVVTGVTPANTIVSDTSGTRNDNNEPTSTMVNRLPVAVNDEATTAANTPVNIQVLDNDDAGSSRFNKQSVTIIHAPARGRLTTNTDGTVVYIPENEYHGEDVFSYRVLDADGYITNIAAVRVTVIATDLKIPTLFTPNGDGRNDVFEIRGLHQYVENELVMINRWGNEVYRQKNYQSNWRGDGMAEGTYYYLLRVRKTSSSPWETMKGYTTLVRKFNQ